MSITPLSVPLKICEPFFEYTFNKNPYQMFNI